ncbi:MAG: response regulator transcription factor [Treponema sp.]|jgi:two-component system alkaline phosphatase synthesis response regulator PhoP|nr:response regulator transcription factor [Treponema sp.]
MTRLVYLVEDDASIRELVIYTLQNTGFEARGFAGGEDFWQCLRERLPSLVILDIMLPGEDGLAILKRLRSHEPTKRLPIMMLTAKGAEYDKVLGLDSGADDYMAKPAGMMELVARVKSLLRRTETQADKDEYRIGGLYVNIPRHMVMVNGEEVSLTLKEFDLLVYLISNCGIVLSRERILQAVWGYSLALETRTVDTHILTLRTKLKACGTLIETVRGVGYKTEGVHEA